MKDLGQLQETLSGVSQAALYSACQYMTPSWLSTAQKHQPLPLVFGHSIPSKGRCFYLRRPCPQQDSNSVTKEHAKLCWIKQMMVGSLCIRAGFIQKSTSFKKFWRGGNGNNLSAFKLLITSVKSRISFHSFRIDTDWATVKPAVNWGMLGVSGDRGNIVLDSLYLKAKSICLPRSVHHTVDRFIYVKMYGRINMMLVYI